MQKKGRCFLSAVLLTAFFTIFVPQAAFADEPDIGLAKKSWHGHMSTVVDRSLYADGSVYQNDPVSDYVVKVGLDYGHEVVSWASFENLSGGGFIFGHYDENRIFHAERQTKAHFIYLNVVSQEQGSEQENGEWDVETLYSFQIVNGIDSAVVLTMDASVDTLAIVSADKGEIRYQDNSYRGGFECRLQGSNIAIVNYVELEDYVKGVVPYEMSSYWPYEALRAQAVCARTYAVYNRDAYADDGFDVTDDTRSQVYKGTGEADSATDAAVDSTVGQLVRYQGEICQVYYFSSDGGATEDGRTVFGSDKPYLAGKTDPFEAAVEFNHSSWQEEKTGEEIAFLLRSDGKKIGTVSRILPTVSRNGNVTALQFYDDDGQCVTIEGKRCYTLLGLHSCNFEVAEDEGSFYFTGGGWGHNCGMSQWGAYAMAENYNYDYQDILRFYFTGAYVA